MEESIIYMYGVINRDNSFGLRISGIDTSSGLYTVGYEDIYAVVSNVPFDEYNEESFSRNVEDMQWLKNKAILHSDITNRIFDCIGSIVPVKFGTIFLDKENVRNFLMENYKSLNENLDKMKQKEEWGLKVYCDIKKFIDAGMEDEKKAIHEQTSMMSKGTRYFALKKLEKSLEDKAVDKIFKLSQKLFDDISIICCEGKLNKLLSKEVTGIPLDMYMNAVFLVKKDDLEFFKQTIENYGMEYDRTGIYIDQNGPWPPYNFCRLE